MTGLAPPASLTLTNTRERILIIGGPSQGKTHDFFTIPRLALATGSDAHFYVIDTDESAGKSLVNSEFRSLWNENMSALLNVTVYSVANWEELLETLEILQGKLVKGKFVTKGLMTNNDWLMIDMLSPTWGWVADWYTQRLFNKGLDEFFLQAREKMKPGDKKMDGLSGWADYGIINPTYAVLQDRILRTPGHIYCTAEVKSISEQADRETKMMFSAHGVTPVGQKRTPHIFSTILWKTTVVGTTREAITIKDRSRPVLEGLPIKDFAVDYLVGIGGWELGEPEVEAAPPKPAKPKLSPAELIARAQAKKEAA